ncbi:hypothetical protein EYF80_039470 [Liparis tanakae]|uniref:Uncharacterized protein n=1 Tax=Liparis tanakae TaxID=230148 RepID=A0A4Z2GCI7_9TELE|nr:hypothetical protein EYF80_039470 [Liparis tanakae]
MQNYKAVDKSNTDNPSISSLTPPDGLMVFLFLSAGESFPTTFICGSQDPSSGWHRARSEIW